MIETQYSILNSVNLTNLSQVAKLYPVYISILYGMCFSKLPQH
mgnify:CR=1 FL=1